MLGNQGGAECRADSLHGAGTALIHEFVDQGWSVTRAIGYNPTIRLDLVPVGVMPLTRMSAGCCATFPDHVLKSPRSGCLITAAWNSADQCNTGFEAENGRNI